MDDRIDFMQNSMTRRAGYILNQDTVKNANMPIVSNEKYEFDLENTTYMRINSFQSIGWPDPFPDPLPIKEETPVSGQTPGGAMETPGL